MIGRRDRIALTLGGAFAMLMPLALLPHWDGMPGGETEPPASPLSAPTPPQIAAAFERPLFAAPTEAAPPDAPQLVGIVGRLDADAVALVRTSDGTTRTLQVGESVDGWTLASLAIDAAFFTRGVQRARVPLPAG